MSTRSKCMTCGATFSGSREETFQWLWHHRTLHALQATAVQRFTHGYPDGRFAGHAAASAPTPRAA